MPARPTDLESDIAYWAFVLAQAAALVAAAAGMRPSAGFSGPVADAAEHILAAVQLLGVALLAPAVAGPINRRAAATIVLFGLIAAKLADRPADHTIFLLAHTLVWSAALSVLGRSGLGRLAGLFLTLGLPVLIYCGVEFAGRRWPTGGWPIWLSPTLGVFTTGPHGGFPAASIAPLAGLTLYAATRSRAKNGVRL